MSVPWALAMLPVQPKRHVRLLSNVQPEKRRDVSCWPIAEAAATGRRVRLLGYCCHQRYMRRRDLRMLRCRYHETKRLSDPPDDAWQTCSGIGCDRSPSRAVARSTIQDNLGRARAADGAMVRHRAQLESAARDVAPCTGPEVGNDCIDGLRLIRPRIEAREPAAMVQRRFPI